MNILQAGATLTRRRALSLGARFTGGLLAATSLGGGASFADSEADHDGDDTAPSPQVQKEIEDIIEAQGMVSDGVLSIEIDRNDITDVSLHGVSIKPSFQINGTLVFQNKDGRIMMNADMALKADEVDPFIDQLIAHDITFQAEHQHFYDFNPLVWFIHFRAMGDPSMVAKGVKAALNVTSTPFPQSPPSNPNTPLPAEKMGDILGAKPMIGADGVVNFEVPRREWIRLGGVHINPYLNVETPIAFQPWGGGHNAAAVPDYGMIASEVQRVVGFGRKMGWDIGCLYNQETDEFPQLYFSHQFKTGDALELAREIRMALDMMNMHFLNLH